MVSPCDFVVIGVYFACLLWLGVAFRRFNRGSRDYFAGGFRVAWWLLGASSFISNFSCWLFTGAASIAYRYGVLIFGFYAIDVLGFALSAAWFAPRFRQLRLVTAMDGVRLRFGAANEQFFTWLNFASALATAAVWLVSLGAILSSAFALPDWLVIAGTGALVSVIAAVGGNWGVVATDFIQLVMLLAVTLVASALTLIRIGGVHRFLAQIPSDHWRLFHPAGSMPYDWLYVISGLFSAFYLKNNLTAAAKYIAAKDGGEARRSALIPLVGYIIMPLVWFIPPFAAFTLAPYLEQATAGWRSPAEGAYMLVVLQVLPRGLIGLLLAGMLSANLSSLAVTLNRNSGFFVRNFYCPVLRPYADDQEQLRVGRLATFALGCAVTVLSVVMVSRTRVSLFDAFLYLNAFLTIPLGLPLFLGLVVRRVPVWSGWATALFGMATSAFLYGFVPTPSGTAFLRSVVGESLGAYAVTNKFVVTQLVSAPLIAVFFCSLRWWWRPADDQTAADFFRRRETAVDFEREVGGDDTARQARWLGRTALGYALFVAALLAVPNSASGRVAIAVTASLIGAVAAALLRRASAHTTS